jgi:hypothetical protein
VDPDSLTDIFRQFLYSLLRGYPSFSAITYKDGIIVPSSCLSHVERLQEKGRLEPSTVEERNTVLGIMF